MSFVPNTDPTELIHCVHFAAEKHKEQRRKDAAKTPYINHPIGKVYENHSQLQKRCEHSAPTNVPTLLSWFLPFYHRQWRLATLHKDQTVVVHCLANTSRLDSFGRSNSTGWQTSKFLCKWEEEELCCAAAGPARDPPAHPLYCCHAIDIICSNHMKIVSRVCFRCCAHFDERRWSHRLGCHKGTVVIVLFFFHRWKSHVLLRNDLISDRDTNRNVTRLFIVPSGCSIARYSGGYRHHIGGVERHFWRWRGKYVCFEQSRDSLRPTSSLLLYDSSYACSNAAGKWFFHSLAKCTSGKNNIIPALFMVRTIEMESNERISLKNPQICPCVRSHMWSASLFSWFVTVSEAFLFFRF